MSRGMIQMVELIDEISMGPFGSDITVDNYVSSGVPVLNGSNISGVKLTENFENYLTPEKAKSLKKANAKRGDIVITHRGTLGQISYIPYDSKRENYVISQSQFRVSLKTDLVDPIYFTYYFHSTEGQKRLLSFKNHVGVPALAQATTNFRLLEFPYRPLKEQKAIAKILSDLDSKISLNNRINQELEAMAKLIYDYWFVQFDFPDDNGKPYKSSGGKMVYNEQLKRAIPEGWGDGTFEDIGEIVGGSTPSRSIDENFTVGDGTPWITPNDLSNNTGNKYITRGEFDATDLGVKDASLRKMPPGTILLTSRAPIGYTAIAREETTTNQGFKSIVPSKGYSTEYTYYTVRLYIKAMIQYASGSTFKEISGGTLRTIKISVPPKELVISFTDKVESIFKKQDILEKENQKLSELRDWLLPMLMNGQVTVGEAKDYVQESEVRMAAEPTSAGKEGGGYG
ncbi:restriction endonuclease subunit S [Ekhidna sp.]|uniref:restriction endonuclease subunit S n=1 Tax=Ekhidna sp. TaxID=2608089 RepID=UPI003B5B45B1